jgi:hypothetical protein
VVSPPGDSSAGTVRAAALGMTNQLDTLSPEAIAAVRGGDASQAQLRELARRYCPQTYAANQHRRTIIRPIAERCLDEAGYGAYKSMLDRYFPAAR